MFPWFNCPHKSHNTKIHLFFCDRRSIRKLWKHQIETRAFRGHTKCGRASYIKWQNASKFGVSCEVSLHPSSNTRNTVQSSHFLQMENRNIVNEWMKLQSKLAHHRFNAPYWCKYEETLGSSKAVKSEYYTLCMHVCVSVCLSVCMYVCLYVCMYTLHVDKPW